MGPGALWAGAVTPLLTSTGYAQNLTTSSFDNNFGFVLQNRISSRNDSYYKATSKGTFTFAVDLDFQGLILNSAQDASDRNGSISNHRKLDKTGYVYPGRSYGAAAATGLTDAFEPDATFYRYNETGLRTETSCIKNFTSDFRLTSLDIPEGWMLHVFNAEGFLPNGVHIMYAAASLDGWAAFAIGAGSHNGSHFTAFAIDEDATIDEGDLPYASLSKIQCETHFTPTMFDVQVNNTEQTIKTQPIHEVQPFANSDDLASRVMHIIEVLGEMLSTTVFTSVLGEAFKNNVINVEAYKGTGEASVLDAVAMSLNSLADSCLETISAAQIEIVNSTQTVTASTQSVSYVFGAFRYHLAVFGLAAAITMLYLEECIRTKFWICAATLDFMNMKSTVVAASAGGTSIAQQANCEVNSRKDSMKRPQQGDFKVVAQDTESGYEVLVIATEAYALVSYEARSENDA